ncbi:MAG: outer membrane beta-barrel protein [Gammaproteobacteria bacterium]|nr:outer membrane beta-barrel protein [Gammaproteobacteria bacterium]
MMIGVRLKNVGIVILALFLALLSFAVSAQGRSGFHTNVEIQLLYDDNVRAVIDELKESDEIFVVNPDLAWIWLYGKHRFDLGYRGNYGFYFDDSILNYDDHRLTAHALLDHTYRLNTELQFGYVRDHDPPGQTNALPNLVSEFDKWRDWNVLGKLYYGRDDSKGQIVAQLDYSVRQYINNNQEFRDYDKLVTTGTFFYRITPDTRLLFEASLADSDFQNKSSIGASQSNKEFRSLTGVTWDITAITTGIFKIGYLDKQHDSSTFSDLSGLTFRLDGIWKPNTYTKISFGAVRDTQDSAQQFSGAFVKNTVRAEVRHAITPRIALVGGLRYGRDEFDDILGREDTRWDARGGVRHSLLRWLEIGVEYRYLERESTVDIFDFKSNIFMITAGTKLD